MGGFYVNVHTQLHQGGEVRGQLFTTDVEATTTLSGGAEVPARHHDSQREATATTNGFSFSLVGTFTGLDSDLQDVSTLGPAHIHVAPADANGSVAFALGGVGDRVNVDVETARHEFGALLLAELRVGEGQRAAARIGRALRRELWHALRRVGEVLDLPDAEPTDLCRAANSLAALANSYRSVTEAADLVPRLEAVEAAMKAAEPT